MEWNERLKQIIDYIENRLQKREEPIDVAHISKIAGCSFGFFQKVFSYMNGISFSEYVRFRKLTLAGYDLKSTNLKIVDISYKYGYESPTSFTKAFQQFHGISPKEARSNMAQLQVFPKMQISSRQQYSWRLESKQSFSLVGKTIQLSMNDSFFQKKIVDFWIDCQQNGVFKDLIALDVGNPKGMFGVIEYLDKETVQYSIMVQTDKKVSTMFHSVIIPKTTWVIFDNHGRVPEAIQNGWKYLNEEWLVNYPFQHAKCPELEWYSNQNPYDSDYLSQIWIPIVYEK